MSNGPKFLPYGRQTIDDGDIAAVTAALRTDFLTTGPLVEHFEQEFARATGASYAVACNSGTAALHLAALAAGLGPGDFAVVPAVTFLSTANAVRMAGADVIFADVDPDTGLMSAETLTAACGSGKVKVAIPVHLGGRVCDMRGMAAVAERNGMVLIEDACHALGVPSIGAAGHSFAACFSTHPVKAIATGEGGLVTTSNANAAKQMMELRTHGMIREAAAFKNRDRGFDNGMENPWYYEMHAVGWNYRLPDILCALGISQLKKLERFWKRRNEIAGLYDKLLAPLSPVIRPVPRGTEPHGLHLYTLLIDFSTIGTTRAKFMRALRKAGIGSQVHYIPVHGQPYYRERYGSLSLPGAEAYYARCLSIPMFPALTNDDVQRVASEISHLAGAAR